MSRTLELDQAITDKGLPSRSSEATAAFWTDHDVRPALAAALHTDRVFEALHSVSGSPTSLHLGLTYVRRKNLSCCAWTIHVKLGTTHRCLNRHRLFTLNCLLLCLAGRGEKANERQQCVSLLHN